MEVTYMIDMDERQRMLFMAEMAQARKETTSGVLLAIFLGLFGAHRFYLGENNAGIFYIVWTLVSIPLVFVLIGILMLVGLKIFCWVEAFKMPDKIRAYNDAQAARIAAQIKGLTALPAPAPPV